jgi:uroporphyrinogen decarboxylase
MPVAVYPGAALTGARVRDLVTNSQAQFEASASIHERFKTPVVMSAMDLSAEAEAFGARVNLPENEIPTVVGSLVTSPGEARDLRVPSPGDKRTSVYLETVERLGKLPSRPLVLGSSIGPFSLAARLVGMTEAFTLTAGDPEWLHVVLEKAASFLASYAKAYKARGAGGVLMAEPAAGLLSPRSMSSFSSAYIKRIVEAVEDESFRLVLHNCAAKPVHLGPMLESGATTLHFGPPMDIPTALAGVPEGVTVCGNLDPTKIFFQSKPEEVARETRKLLAATREFSSFVISSGCDVPPGSPIGNLQAFFEAAAKG